MRGDARVNLEILGRLGHTVVEVTDEQEWNLHFSDIATCGLVVDALFGTGLSRPLEGVYQRSSAIQRIRASRGVGGRPERAFADTADVMGEAIEADLT